MPQKVKTSRDKRVAKIIRQMGIKQELSRLSKWRQTILTHEYAPPEFKYHESVPEKLRDVAILDKFRTTLNDHKVEDIETGDDLTFLEMIRTAIPIYQLSHSLIASPQRFENDLDRATVSEIARKAKVWMDFWWGKTTSILSTAQKAINNTVDSIFITHDLAKPESHPLANTTKSTGYTIVFRVTEPQSKSIWIDGLKRTIYRVGCYVSGEFVWSTMTDPNGRTGEVWIQRHALQRLDERQKLINATHLLVDAFLKPNLIQYNGLLMEARIGGHRVGYFAMLPIDDIFLVSTFYLTSMAGTPEGDRLKNHLRHGKDDSSYNDLDKLETFVTTDIFSNHRLKAMFIACGLEPLIRLNNMFVAVAGEPDEIQSVAVRLEKYYMLGRSKFSQFDRGWDLPELEIDKTAMSDTKALVKRDE